MALGTLEAFNTVVGVASLALGVAGVTAPNPLNARFDKVDADLARLETHLGDLKASVESMSTAVMAEFDLLTRRDIATARASVETAEEQLQDYRRLENPTAAEKAEMTLLANAALNEMLAQFVALPARLSADMTTVMVEAVNYAITLRLTVALEVEDGAFGKAAIRDAIDDTAATLKRIEAAFHAGLENVLNFGFNTTTTNKVNLTWPAWQVADVLPFPINVEYDLKGNEAISAEHIIDRFTDYDSILGRLGTDRAHAAYTYRAGTAFASSTVLDGVTSSAGWESVHYHGDAGEAVDTLAARIADVRQNIWVQEKLTLKQLSQSADTLQQLADGEDFVGGSGVDSHSGTMGNDLLSGLAGDDILNGRGDADVIRGGTGNDTMKGGGGNDLLDGAAGRDTGLGGAGDDTLLGGDGADTLSGGGGRDRIAGGEGRDKMAGNAGADTLGGEAGNDRLDGGNGNDVLLGGAGGDRLIGGAGRDRIEGGRGNDILAGGKGPNTFVFTRRDGSDRVTDFELGSDRILIEGVDASTYAVLHQNGDTHVSYGLDDFVIEGVTATLADLGLLAG